MLCVVLLASLAPDAAKLLLLNNRNEQHGPVASPAAPAPPVPVPPPTSAASSPPMPVPPVAAPASTAPASAHAPASSPHTPASAAAALPPSPGIALPSDAALLAFRPLTEMRRRSCASVGAMRGMMALGRPIGQMYARAISALNAPDDENATQTNSLRRDGPPSIHRTCFTATSGTRDWLRRTYRGRESRDHDGIFVPVGVYAFTRLSCNLEDLRYLMSVTMPKFIKPNDMPDWAHDMIRERSDTSCDTAAAEFAVQQEVRDVPARGPAVATMGG
jgi:hypothetical protein